MSRRATALVSAVLLLGVASATGTAEDKPFTVNPRMARGPASAPVTIFEFSDYQ